MRLGLLAGILVVAVPFTAWAQPASPVNQGPMIVERIHSGFLVAPDVEVTEVDHKTSELVGGYAGWLTDDALFVGGGGYWLPGKSRDDRDMAYGGLVLQWLAFKSGRLSFGGKGLLGGGEATLSEPVTIRIPEVRAANGRIVQPATTTASHMRFHQGFFAAEPEALVGLRLTRQLRLTAGGGYRFTGSDRRGGARLDGATGSVGLQIGGGS